MNWYQASVSVACLLTLLMVPTIGSRGEPPGGGHKKRDHQSSHKSVSLSLEAKWRETPLHLETMEFLGEEKEGHFWAFLEVLSQRMEEGLLSQLAPKSQYDITQELAAPLLGSQAKLSLLQFSLGLRVHSPAVEMFHQIAIEKLKQLDLKEETPSQCTAFVEFSRLDSGLPVIVCDPENISHTIEQLYGDRELWPNLVHPVIYKLDHIYPGSQTHSPPITAVLYGEVGISPFLRMHSALKKAANDGKVKYLVRHYMSRERKSQVSLSGYGVELAIKSTEYKAQDDARVKGEESSLAEDGVEADNKPEKVDGFDFSTLRQLHPEKSKKLDDFHSHLLDSNKEVTTLKVWELQELSLQAAKRILSSPKEDQLRVLRDISQNFPTYAKSLVHVSVDNEMHREVEKNQHSFMQNLNLGTGDTALFVNGMFFDMDATDVFTLLHHLKQETRLVEGLHRVLGEHLDSQVDKLLRLELNDDKQEYQIDIRDSAIVYINDIETEKMYKSWPSSLQDMLRPTYPGMLRNVRKNMYHLVLVVDPSKKETHDIIKLSESFYVHKAPLRIGLVFVTEKGSANGFEDASLACLNAFNFISQEKTPYEGLSFLTDVIAGVEEQDLLSKNVIDHFKAKYPGEDYDLIFGSDSDYDTGRKLTSEFLNKTGLGTSTKALLNGVILKESHLNAELFEEAVLTEIMRQTPIIQKGIYAKELTDDKDVLDWLMSQKNVMPRLSKRILGTDPSYTNRYLDLTGEARPDVLSSDGYSSLQQSDLTATLHKRIKYITNEGSSCLPVTVWIAADFQSNEGRHVLGCALRYLRSNSNYMRLGIVHLKRGPIGKAIEAGLSITDNMKDLSSYLSKLLLDNNAEKVKENILAAVDLIPQNYQESLKNVLNESTFEDQFELHRVFGAKSLGLEEGQIAVAVNGRVIEVPADDLFCEDDYSLIEKYLMATYGDKLLAELSSKVKEDARFCSDTVMNIGSVLMAYPQSKVRHELKYHSDKHSVISLDPMDPNRPALEVVAVLEPVSRGAQKLSSVLITLQKVLNMKLKVFLNCIDKHSDMPLKSFFRYVMDSEPQFGDGGLEDVPKWRAHFMSMPVSPLFTLAMVTPENWLVEAVRSPYDLDNIHLEEISGNGVWADFELENLLLEGHCFEQSSGNPPRGLQFVLGTNSTPITGDTTVMANLGYFQLKANPGAWLLSLRPGRSSDIYTIVSHEGPESSSSSSSDSGDLSVLMSSFKSHVIKIRVNKKAGKQQEELLYDGDEEEYEKNTIWGSISSLGSWAGKKSGLNASQETDDRLNIFSLASGHLYERLLRIMMLSVLKHTKTPVKFWFLKNYLSPTFKDLMPRLAEKYGFEYELVEYKWPRWLHQQTEKQRIIWGYKILFLDVLFPLNVKKIIFVDADQVVRTDLKELRDFDLEGAPYGYTPFCDSRKEMDGYRFWKNGYWASHLHGRKYHISALYVVDLQKFRRIAAGDRLRGQYQGLSQDPNSLSNLDQDLPNNMIHQVAIKSLPQEWLWCETWCNDASKETAKTIDLCNNPKTKEPKLTAARRILPEWQGYDDEIKKIIQEMKPEAGRTEPKTAAKPPAVDDPQESPASPTPPHIEL